MAAANEGDCFMEARGGLVENVQKKGDELKDPPEGLGMNVTPLIEYQMASVNECDCIMEAENVRNKGGLNDPPPIEYQMAAANEGDCFMEARGGFVENIQVDIIGDQWNLKKKKIFFGGRPYKCNKVRGGPEKKGSTITKYYSCQMVLFNREGERWKPLQLPKGSLSVESPKKKAKTDTVLTYNICNGTLHGIFSMGRGKMKHLFRAGNINHISHNPTWVEGTTLDIREPLMFIVPSVHCQITDALINSVKQSLESTKSGWVPLGHCDPPGNICLAYRQINL